MGIRCLPVDGETFQDRRAHKSKQSMQLPDARAPQFSTATLKKAMLDTVAALNTYADELGVTEVHHFSANVSTTRSPCISLA